jgi:CBS domain-containing protein
MPRPRRPERAPPPPYSFAQRLAALRALLPGDPAGAGDQALKLLEEYLERLAQGCGFRGEAGMGRYVQFLRGRDALPGATLDRAEGYTQARNCLAHTYGLQPTPALAAEVLDFVAELLKQGAVTAGEVMTRDVRTVGAGEPLAKARDLMLREGYGRLPVLRDGGGIVGLLTERDVVLAQSLAERTGRTLAGLTVGEALPEDAVERLALAAPEASLEEVTALLRRTGVVACLVTPHGRREERPVGIITHADLLFQL